MKRLLFTMLFSLLMLPASQPAFSFSSKAISAKAWIVIDEYDSVLYAKNSSAKLPPASTVKLITAMVALDLLDPAAMVKVSNKARATRSGKPRLMTDDELTVSDLLHMALMKSINSAAVALAEGAAGSEDAFVELMNQKAKEIGANDTHFVTASGLPKGRQFTTARDLTIILKKALTYPLIKEILGKKTWIVRTAAGRELFLSNTDDLLWYRSNMVGGKTGFTCNARHCFVGAMDTENGRIYTAVLGAPSRSRLWKSTMMLADIGNDSRLNSAFPVYFDTAGRSYGMNTLQLKTDRTSCQDSQGGIAGLQDPIDYRPEFCSESRDLHYPAPTGATRHSLREVAYDLEPPIPAEGSSTPRSHYDSRAAEEL